VVKGCFNETIMETAYTGMVDALTTMIREEGLENGGMFEDTREMMIKVYSVSLNTGFLRWAPVMRVVADR